MRRPINERAQPLNEQQVNAAGRYLLNILDTFKKTGRNNRKNTTPQVGKS